MDESMIAEDLSIGAASGPPAAASSPRSHHDASDPALLPDPSPLPMPEQDFSAMPPREWPKRRGPSIPRTAVFLGAA